MKSLKWYQWNSWAHLRHKKLYHSLIVNICLLLIKVLSLITLMLVEVEFDITSVQFTSVRFKQSLTGLITSLDISGRLPTAETLEKVNVIEFTSKCDIGVIISENKTREYFLAIVSPSGIRRKLHSIDDPCVVHVNSNLSPLHTGAIPGGDSITPIMTRKIIIIIIIISTTPIN